MKGWLEDRRVAIPYSMAMRYKKHAQRLREILHLDDRIPLEWVLEGLPNGQWLPTSLQSAFGGAARRLAGMLRENPTLAALGRYVERKLGIVRLVAVGKSWEKGMVKNGKTKEFSVISRGWRATVSPERVEATKAAMGRVPGARNLAESCGWGAAPAEPHQGVAVGTGSDGGSLRRIGRKGGKSVALGEGGGVESAGT